MSGNIIEINVVSWPPCIVEVDVNTAAGLPASAPLSQRADVLSRKYLSGAAIFPKRVGEPSASAEHCVRSSSSTYGGPSVGIAGAVASLTGDTLGTVRTRAVAP